MHTDEQANSQVSVSTGSTEHDLLLQLVELRLKQYELDSREKKSSRQGWFTSPVLVAVASTVFGLLGTGVGATLQGYWNARLERQKFEATLIQEALKPEDQEQRANRLLFLTEVGLVNGLNVSGIRKRIAEPSTLPRYEGELAEQFDLGAFIQDLPDDAQQAIADYNGTRLSEIPTDVWSKLRPEIHTALEAATGKSLPADFWERNRNQRLLHVLRIAFGAK